jgi:hypothetical protein
MYLEIVRAKQIISINMIKSIFEPLKLVIDISDSWKTKLLDAYNFEYQNANLIVNIIVTM